MKALIASTYAFRVGDMWNVARDFPGAADFVEEPNPVYVRYRHEGASGARLIDRISDPALRLFARIEFAAGLAGLEQIGGITREHAGSSMGPQSSSLIRMFL
ncbi:MAG: hypothetical protein ACRD1U_09865 [Vicinamibacterales bacterium]